MLTAYLKDVYSKNQYKVNQNTLDLQFLRDICTGQVNAGKFFNETTIYRKKVFLDAPNGHFEGVAQIDEFAKRWLKDFKASSAEVYPVIQTIANGRICTEMEVWFHLNDDGIKKVPVVTFSDLIGENKLEGMRIYFFYQFLDGAIAYRKPIFRPRFNSWSEPPLMTGVMRYYYEQINNFRTKEAFNNIIDMCSDDLLYGGYRPAEVEPIVQGKMAIQKHYASLGEGIVKEAYVRFETICDDGVTFCGEWTLVLRKNALAIPMVSLAGCAMYERAKDGKLYSIRICDNVGCELGIDLNSIPDSDMFIE